MDKNNLIVREGDVISYSPEQKELRIFSKKDNGLWVNKVWRAGRDFLKLDNITEYDLDRLASSIAADHQMKARRVCPNKLDLAYIFRQ